jgi:uncharacterized protein YndB with AHSA1/START domain
MTSAKAQTAPKGVPEFHLSRVFDAPREIVYAAFTEPECIKHWWGPKGFAVIKSEMDLRPAGTYHYGLRGPDGGTMWGKFVYREIVRPEQLVLISCFSDEAGGIARRPMSPTWPLEMLSVVLFEEVEPGKTTVTVKASPHDASDEERATFAAARAGMNLGWSGTFDQLAAYLAR